MLKHIVTQLVIGRAHESITYDFYLCMQDENGILNLLKEFTMKAVMFDVETMGPLDIVYVSIKSYLALSEIISTIPDTEIRISVKDIKEIKLEPLESPKNCDVSFTLARIAMLALRENARENAQTFFNTLIND